MRASCVFPSGGLVFQPNESSAQKSYIMINFLGVGKNQLWQHEKGTWYSRANFIFILAFSFWYTHHGHIPKKYLKSSFCFVFSKIMRLYLYTGIRCSLGYYHVVFTRPLPHRRGYFRKRVLSCSVFASGPDVIFGIEHTGFSSFKMLTDELIVTWFSNRRNSNSRGWR